MVIDEFLSEGPVPQKTLKVNGCLNINGCLISIVDTSHMYRDRNLNLYT